ncbi:MULTISPECIES: hypothetical protein [Streptomyces]|uniref:Cysteinyl-tRNA synthetase n=1 Tax=Streptomyces spinosisporus TaxID=2927582 RepID=A0ABS9XW68_9ACTN|nr:MULTISPECIES: hypothetical protein [Streptomyces]MCI3245142.1 hypothetical protein [Streptomyces spinosisporus]WUB39890.1 hypothetical protein OHN38_35145 [Streptomyces sp. NBC_00588]
MPARGRPRAYAHPVLRITDARTGEPVEAAPARRGLTRVEAHVPGFGAGSLRVVLVADVLLRALELGGTPVWAVLNAEREHPQLRAGVAALGIRPFEDRRDVGSGLGEAQILHVVAEGGARPDGVRIAVAPVHSEEPGIPEGVDPTALRLALLSRRRDLPVTLDAAALDEARATLVRWRRAVAAWAQRPSRPIPDEARARLRSAWEDDLDVPAVLDVLTWVEAEDELPDGARFETYAYADRLLGVDLTRELGTLA